MKTVTRNMGCKHCGESGKTYTYEDLGDGDRGSINGTQECFQCKGRKLFQMLLLMSDDDCSARLQEYSSTLECHSGTMRNVAEYYEYGKNLFGQETRKKIAIGQVSKQCPFCFGTGKAHYLPKKKNCSKCGGRGELKESRWEKTFFDGEVKREYCLTCSDCGGKKFAWEIDHRVANSQVYQSNL